MKIRQMVCLLLGVVLSSPRADLRAGEQPTIDPEQGQSILVDASGDSTLRFTARGGECVPPDAGTSDPGGSGWQKDGDVVYVWSYDNGPDGLVGSPVPDQLPDLDAENNEDTLSFDTNEGGSVSIIVYAVQRWRTADGRTTITCSPAS